MRRCLQWKCQRTEGQRKEGDLLERARGQVKELRQGMLETVSMDRQRARTEDSSLQEVPNFASD